MNRSLRRTRRERVASVSLTVLVLGFGIGCTPPASGPPSEAGAPQSTRYASEYYSRWRNGPNPSGDPNVFPINVWLQDPSGIADGAKLGNAYRGLGIDTTLGLWEDDWWYLRRDGLRETGWRAYVDPKRIDAVLADPARAKHYVGYLLADEPDMNKVYGDVFHPEYQPSALVNDAKEVRAKDPSRPTYINFGVWMGTPGGSIGYGYIEKSYEHDMRAYCSAADIASADFYGWTHPDPDERGGAWSYGQVIDTMRKWCGPGKPLYGFVETGHPHADGGTITGEQLEQAVWNSILHGATGINYFAHSFYTNGQSDEASALTRSEIAARVRLVNSRLRSLAPVLNAPNRQGARVRTTEGIPVSVLHKVHGGAHYVLAQADGNKEHPGSGGTTATIAIPVPSGAATVLDEDRTVPIVDGEIVDRFEPYEVHVYRF